MNRSDFNIEDVVRLKEDIFYGAIKEIDHIRISAINEDGTFNGTGICNGEHFSIMNPDKWEKTMEK